ncbi:MAG: hypothetical protein AB2A00_28550 [Myxococcota bacterium]
MTFNHVGWRTTEAGFADRDWLVSTGISVRDSLACPPEKPDCGGKLPQGLNAELLVTGTIGAVGEQFSVNTLSNGGRDQGNRT